jgi:hypothetical protein
MKYSVSFLKILCSAMLLLVGFSSQASAQVIFSDDFEDRVRDQALIGNDYTWFDYTFAGNDCTGEPVFFWGPWEDGDGADFYQENRNYWTASNDVGQGDSYFRAGLEVPAWDGATTNMLRVYGDQYYDTQAQGCKRSTVFKEMSIASSGSFTFSFDVAQDRYGAPQNGEGIGAFVKVLKSSDVSYATLLIETVEATPPAATSPGDVTTASQEITFVITPEMEGELLQFGFYSEWTPALGQSWATAGAYYDNLELAPTVILPPGPRPEYEGVPVPLWAYFLMGGLIVLVGGLQLQARRKT